MSLSSPTRFGAVYVTAMDDREPIRAARRLLITAVGPARNTGMEYETTARRSRRSEPLWHLKHTGTAPALLEAVTGELLIKSDRAKELKAWTLDVVGKRIREVPVHVQDGAVQLKLGAEIRDRLLRVVGRCAARDDDEPGTAPSADNGPTLLTSRHLPAAAAVLSVVLALPALGAGWILDDYFHRTILLGKSQLRELLGTPSEMFRFFRGDPERTGQLMDLGLFPWWTDPGLKAEFLQALTILTHRLDYALWPDSPALMHAHSLVWLGAVVAVTAVFYRRMMGATWTAGVAALLFAVDDARGPTVGFLANRNALVAATFGVSALIAHDRWRRDGSRPASLLAPLLLLAALFSKEEGIGTCAYLAAYATVRRPRGLAARVPVRSGLMPRRSSPGAALRASWGYGVRDVGLYIDPLTDTGRFLAAAAWPNPDPPARPVEPDPGGSRRGAVASGRRRHVVDRGGVPRAGSLRDGPAPPPRSPRSLLGRRHAPRHDPRLRHASRWTGCSRSRASARSACWPSTGRSCSAMLPTRRRARPGASRRWRWRGSSWPSTRSLPRSSCRSGPATRWGPGGSRSGFYVRTPLGSSVGDRTARHRERPEPRERELPHPPPGAERTVRAPAHPGPRAGGPLGDDPSPRRADARDQAPRRLPQVGPRPGLPERAPTIRTRGAGGADGNDRHDHLVDRRRPPRRGDVPVRRAAGIPFPALALLPRGRFRAVHSPRGGPGGRDPLRLEGAPVPRGLRFCPDPFSYNEDVGAVDAGFLPIGQRSGVPLQMHDGRFPASTPRRLQLRRIARWVRPAVVLMLAYAAWELLPVWLPYFWAARSPPGPRGRS